MNKTIVKPLSGQGYYTVFNNALLDFVMPSVGYAEWKVLCFVVRKTIGWQKDSDKLSYSQIMSGTGIKNRTTVSNACKGLVKRGLLTAIYNKKILDELDKNGEPKVINLTTDFVINRAFEMEIDTKTLKNKANNGNDSGSTEGVLPSTEGVPGGSTEGVPGGSTEGVPGVVQKVYQQNKDSKHIFKTNINTIDETDISSAPSTTPFFEFDLSEAEEISHWDVEGATLYADLKGNGQFSKHVNLKSTPQRIKLSTGEGPKDFDRIDPKKKTVVYRNNGTVLARVVIGEKHDDLSEKEKAILNDLKELFTLSSSATKKVQAKHYSELKEFAINVAKHYGTGAIQAWSTWHDHERKELSGSKSEQFGYIQKTLDEAIVWYKERMVQ